MLRPNKALLSLSSLFLLVYPSLFAQEDSITMTTYYPSPYGSYREMRAKRMAVGDDYIDGATYSWDSFPTTINADADLVVEGNVGIGTTAPGNKLHVLGTIQSDWDYTTSRINQLYLRRLNSGSFDGSAFSIDVGMGLGLTNLVSGAVINSAASGYNYLGTRGASRIYLSDGYLYFFTGNATTGTTGSSVTWSNSNAAAMTIDYNGSVGIGTATPQGKLAIELPNDGWNGYDPIMKLSAWQDGGNNSGNGGAIDFYVNNQTSYYPSSRIIHTMSSGTGGELSFATTENYTTTLPTRKLVIKGDGNVGIGTTAPGGKLSVYRAPLDYGPVATFVGDDFGNWGDTATRVQITDLTGGIAWYLTANNNGTFALHQGGQGDRITFATNGNVGIGTADPGSYKCYINGTGYLNAAAWTYGSDKRLKKNITYLQKGLDIIEQLKPAKFDYIQGEKRQVGFIAQDIEEVLPDTVTKGQDGMLGTKTESIIPYLVKAIQEQQQEIEGLKTKIISLEKDNILVDK